VFEASSRRRHSKHHQQDVDDDIAEIFHDDDEVSGSKSMMIVSETKNAEDIAEDAKRRKFNSLRGSKGLAGQSLGNINEAAHVVHEFNEGKGKAIRLPKHKETNNNKAVPHRKASMVLQKTARKIEIRYTRRLLRYAALLVCKVILNNSNNNSDRIFF
jgi:hypothetical protein